MSLCFGEGRNCSRHTWAAVRGSSGAEPTRASWGRPHKRWHNGFVIGAAHGQKLVRNNEITDRIFSFTLSRQLKTEFHRREMQRLKPHTRAHRKALGI